MTKKLPILYAILAAAFYALNAPLSKQLVEAVSPTMLAAFLYLGAGLGLTMLDLFRRALGKPSDAAPLTKHELPYTVAMVLLDILAPILLMLGVARTNAANVSLLNNFEIVATALIAFFLFREKVSRTLAAAIVLVTAASILLGFEGTDGLVLNTGSLFVLGACVSWGFENNCTRKLSDKSSTQIVMIKGSCSGLGSLIIALVLGERFPSIGTILGALLLGFVAYGLSIKLYIMAQHDLGAAKTSAFYSIAPFLGVLFSMLLGEKPGALFFVALAVMAVATWMMVKDSAGE